MHRVFFLTSPTWQHRTNFIGAVVGAQNPQNRLADLGGATIPAEGHSPKAGGSNTCSHPEGSERLGRYSVVELVQATKQEWVDWPSQGCERGSILGMCDMGRFCCCGAGAYAKP